MSKNIQFDLEEFRSQPLPTEEEIIATWEGGLDNPVVSVICHTFNHKYYLEDALRGFLIQKTSFPFEIILHDDASTDGTTDIVQEQARKYPGIIKPVIQTVNQFSRGRKPSLLSLPYAKGKYIAVCDGDDFWIDREKLQIQVDFLNTHPDFVVSGHDAILVDKDGKLIRDTTLFSHRRDRTGEDLILGKVLILALGRVYRNIDIGNIPERKMVLNGDYFVTSLLGHHGKSKYHSDIKPAVYRFHEGGVWSSLGQRGQVEAHINTYFWMYRYYSRVGQKEYAVCFWDKYLSKVFTTVSFKIIASEFIIRLLFLREARRGLSYILRKTGLRTPPAN